MAHPPELLRLIHRLRPGPPAQNLRIKRVPHLLDLLPAPPRIKVLPQPLPVLQLLPRRLDVGPLRPLAEAPRHVHLARGAKPPRRWVARHGDDGELRLVDLGRAVGDAEPARQLRPESAVRERRVVDDVERLIRRAVGQDGPFGERPDDPRIRHVFVHIPSGHICREVQFPS